ncbi:MAG: SDR family oxidoreductase [Gammaproteobacteria bacterium]|nr:SDR family oxidoreductase [Gammaproteobacteria bacterium]MBU1557178.1 SDR family oxidoreductase [Gammaproteobacteria bacterium]MBU2070400.1 SDR family oxidoreductase [Gammaproteobacteria bacterium]MBU2184738.1 SDR family oxidoreductase [Gammaproteobacteria bacterium]MBU2203653.1 SDR family oxidoreductase [Gammaproteobacteria bacterium]
MTSLFSLAGQTALVTGASRGLGRAIALALADAGATVLCASSTANGSASTVAAIQQAGGKASALAADLTNETAVEQLAADALAQGPVHILVNCGGTIFRAPAHQFPMSEWHKVIAVNLDAAFLLSQRLGAAMIDRQHGKIINIASMLSYSGGITVPAYTASKHAIAGVTKALANEWAQHNIQVNAIAPGYFSTDNTAALQADTARNAAITARIPAGRWGEPEDLAGAAVFLASKASDYVNGHVLAVDGGWLAR